MNIGSNDDVIVFFGSGKTVQARLINRINKMHLIFYLPHLDPGSEIDIIEQIEAQTSCTAIRRAIVKKVSGSNNIFGQSLRASVELELSQNDLSPAPANQARVSLVPTQSSNPLKAVISTIPGTDKNIILAEYEISDAKIGEEIQIQDRAEKIIKARIEEAKFESKNSDINITACIVQVKQYNHELDLQNVAQSREDSDESNQLPSTEEPKELEHLEDPITTKPQSLEDESRDKETEPSRQALLPKIPQKQNSANKIDLYTFLAYCTLGMIIMFIAIGVWYLDENGYKQTTAQIASLNSSPTLALSTNLSLRNDEKITQSFVKEEDPILLPMTTQNLQKFFGQSNALKVKGKLDGKIESDKLGIICPELPRYSKATNTTDVSACFIALPTGTVPGEYKLTKESAEKWFHQTDPNCFWETDHDASAINRNTERLRVNVEKCDWSFDAIRKCFDYSKCTFTIPKFKQ